MIPIQSGSFKFGHENKNDYFYEVILNGKPLGYIESANVNDLTTKLRYLKAKATAENSKDVPKYMEICLLPKIDKSESDNTSAYSIYPGLYIFTGPGRMMRPVINLATNNNEYIGSMEQCYLHICIKPEEFVEGVSHIISSN
jgi:DNA-directed RNA polymerase I subunit RPA2